MPLCGGWVWWASIRSGPPPPQLSRDLCVLQVLSIKTCIDNRAWTWLSVSVTTFLEICVGLRSQTFTPLVMVCLCGRCAQTFSWSSRNQTSDAGVWVKGRLNMQHSTHAECNPNWGAGITSWVIYYNCSPSFLVLYVRVKRFGCLVPVFSTEARIYLYTKVVILGNIVELHVSDYVVYILCIDYGKLGGLITGKTSGGLKIFEHTAKLQS